MVPNRTNKERLGRIIDIVRGYNISYEISKQREIYIHIGFQLRLKRNGLLKSSGQDGRCAGTIGKPPTLMAAQLCCVVTRYPEGVMHVEVQPKCNGPETIKGAYMHITA